MSKIYPHVVAIVISCGPSRGARQWFSDRALIEDLAAFDRNLVARRFPNSVLSDTRISAY